MVCVDISQREAMLWPKLPKTCMWWENRLHILMLAVQHYCCTFNNLRCVWFQMDYRSLIHEKDEAAYCEIRVILLDIRGYYVCISFDWIGSLARVLHFLQNMIFNSLTSCNGFCRQSCMTSSVRTWRRWWTQKEKRSPACTETETHLPHTPVSLHIC